MRAILSLLIAAVAVSAGPPNVVMILGDDQHYGDYGFMGHPHIRTPHLDQLAKESLVYERGYVPTSLCRASLASVVTGLWPHQHKVTSNDPPMPAGLTLATAQKNPEYQALRRKMVEIFERSPNLPRWFAGAGYVSHQSGKWWEGNACRCGFSEGMTIGDWAKGGRHGDAGLTIGRQGLQPVFEFLDQAKREGKPFFVWYAPMMPHTPHNPPERLLAKYRDKTPHLRQAKYWAMCEWFDESVGDLLAKLKANGQEQNMIVVYLADNGWIQDFEKDTYAAKSKRSPYDGGLRTPILLRWPGVVTPERREELASSIDIAPTLLAACGMKPQQPLPGLDLRQPLKLAERNQVAGATFEHNAIDLEKPAVNLQHRWIVQGDWKLIVAKDGIRELYHLKADPKEEKPLNDTAKQNELQRALDAWWPLPK